MNWVQKLMKNYIFVLLENFSLLAFSSAIEPLRLANRMSKTDKFFWKLVSVENDEVSCSNGTKIKCDGTLDSSTYRDDTIIICGGTNIKDNMTKIVERLIGLNYSLPICQQIGAYFPEFGMRELEPA